MYYLDLDNNLTRKIVKIWIVSKYIFAQGVFSLKDNSNFKSV